MIIYVKSVFLSEINKKDDKKDFHMYTYTSKVTKIEKYNHCID